MLQCGMRNDEPIERLLIGGGDGTVQLYEGDGRSYRSSTSAQVDGAVSALQLLDDADTLELLIGTTKGFVSVLKLGQQSSLRLVQENHCSSVRCVSFAPDDSETFATISDDGTIRLWDGNSYQVISKGEVQAPVTGPPSSVCFTGEVIFSGWFDGKIRAHDAEDGKLLWTIDECHRGGVTSLQVSHNRKFLVSGGEEGEVRAWEIRTREMIRHLKQHTMAVTSVMLTQDDQQLYSASRDRSILCWDLVSGQRTTSLTQRMGGLNAIALVPADPCQLVSVGQEKRLSIWSVREPTPTVSLDTGGDEQNVVCTSVDGKYIATGGVHCKVRLWQYDKDQPVCEGIGHSAPIRGLAFSPDGKQLVSVGDDANVLVWNIY